MEKQNPFTLAWSKENVLFSNTGEVYDHTDNFSNPVNINISDISTFLIQNVGRYCDRYASDLFISHESLMNTINNLNPDRKTEYMWFGLRESGIDGIAYIIANIKDHSPEYVSEYYRKVFCIRISSVFIGRFTVELADMSYEIYSIARKVKETDFTLQDYDASIGNENNRYNDKLYEMLNEIRSLSQTASILKKEPENQASLDYIMHSLYNMQQSIKTIIDTTKK
mgnify:CR=1 FL=1